MNDNEHMIIRETILKLRENIASQILLMESLSALLPKQKKEKPSGYYTDPYGKKQYYDKAAKRRHEIEQRKLDKEKAEEGKANK